MRILRQPTERVLNDINAQKVLPLHRADPQTVRAVDAAVAVTTVYVCICLRAYFTRSPALELLWLFLTKMQTGRLISASHPKPGNRRFVFKYILVELICHFLSMSCFSFNGEKAI